MRRRGQPVILGVIPARLNSTRLPGKVLRSICGHAMLHHVFARASRCELLEDLVVATDSKEVHEYCVRNGMKVVMTSSSHISGTDRVHEVTGMMPADIYVNIQGDEPMIRPEHLRVLLQPFMEDASVQVTTLKTPMNGCTKPELREGGDGYSRQGTLFLPLRHPIQPRPGNWSDTPF